MTYILNEVFCLYCQREFKSPKNLQRHVREQHPKTYAAATIQKALDEREII